MTTSEVMTADEPVEESSQSSWVFVFLTCSSFFSSGGGLTCCSGSSVVTVVRLKGTGVVHLLPVDIRTFFLSFPVS